MLKKLALSTALIAGLLSFGNASSAIADDSGSFISNDDCSSKYNRPIKVINSYGKVTFLRVNTADGFCVNGIDSPVFEVIGDTTESASEGDGDGGSDGGGDGGGEGEG